MNPLLPAIPNESELTVQVNADQLHELLGHIEKAVTAAQPALDKLKALGGSQMTGLGAELFGQMNMAVGRYRHVRDTIAALWRAKNTQERAQLDALLERRGR